MTAALLPLLVLAPIAVAAVLAVLPERARPAVAIAGVLATSAVAVAVVLDVARNGPVELVLAGWDLPLGIALRADALAAAFLGLTAVVGPAVTIYATGHEKVRGGPAFWPLWLFLLGALNGVWIAGDLFNAYVTLELVTVAAVSLVALGGSGAAGAALRYLFVAVVGSLLFLLAVALVYGETGTLDMVRAGEGMADSPLLPVVLVLCAVGLGAKLALVPLHSWLPVAHPAAPAAVSAVLSALVIKASLVVLLRVWFTLAPGTPAAARVGTVVAAFGALAVVWGAVMALRRRRLKQIVAYSTVSQVGYLVLVLALASPLDGVIDDAAVAGWTGGVLIALAHGLAKAAMFLAAGTLALAYGSDRLAGLRGAVTRMPMTVAALGVAGVSLAGLPPTFGFVPKWQLLSSSIASDEWWWFVPLLVGGLLAFAYTAVMVRATFNVPGDDDVPTPQRVSAVLSVTPFVLAVLAVVLGLAAAPLAELIGSGYPGSVLDPAAGAR
ncbi:sodium:proton antiporter [Serinibacter arcticus]|uniref:Sodium:proton antiporter n=1 Tax=Serinibacter arcticus TaxID=1655435 RepID=A0A2U1ZTV5_9MICO|nr:proton-conducting transporter membrane subunit [Serinibacter arcticus]PWD50401.1 sodium:proton antiporter [Serinibacter arcticus]